MGDINNSVTGDGRQSYCPGIVQTLANNEVDVMTRMLTTFIPDAKLNKAHTINRLLDLLPGIVWVHPMYKTMFPRSNFKQSRY